MVINISVPSPHAPDRTDHNADDPIGSRRGESVGHRMRSPLHAILGYTGLLKADASDEVLERLGIIEDSAHQLLAIINELPEYASMVTHEPRASTDPAHTPASDTITSSMTPLPNAEITTFRNLLKSGHLLQIERWATGLIDRYPSHAGSAHHLIALSRSADLPALERLLEQWTEPNRMNPLSADNSSIP